MKKFLAILLAAILCLSVFAACGDNSGNGGETEETTVNNEDVVYNVENAVAYLKNMYKGYLTAPETAADYELTSQVMVAGAVYSVTWAVNTDKITVTVDEANKKVVVDIDEKSAEKLDYELTATVTAPDGTTGNLVFKLIVPAYEILSYDAYMAAEANKAVIVQGVVIAVHSQEEGNKYNMLYVQDLTGAGAYYVYSMKEDPAKDKGIKAGMIVKVTGTKDIYNGTHEIKDATAEIVDSTIKTVEPLDITELFQNASDLSDSALTSKLGMLVTIKGVEITDQDLSEKSQYFKFKLGNNESYIRVYATDCPAAVSDADMATIIAKHAEHKGWNANVTGVVVTYNNQIYLNPVSVDCFEYLGEITRTDAEKVDYEIGNVTIDSAATINKVIDLPATGVTYTDVAITWESDNACAVVAGGKLTITLPKEATTVTLTATFTLGEITKTQTYTIAVSAAPSVVPSPVVTPAVDTAYKFFYTQTQIGKNLYFDGTAGNYYGNTTDDMEKAVDVYLEAAEGGYYLYFYDTTNTKTYIEAYLTVSGDKTYCNMRLTTETPESVFVIDEAINAPVVTLGETTYFLGTYGDKTDIRPSAYKYASQGNYICRLATLVDIADCAHSYSGDCDAICNICNTERTVEADHTWENACDADCNVCGATRTPSEHVYDNDCDTDCNVCTAGRSVPGHNYVDGECTSCGAEEPSDSTIETVEITKDNLFTGLTGTSYATYDGTHALGDYTITTSNVLGNSHGVDSVLQFKAGLGTLTVKNVSVSSITIIVVSSYNYTGHYVGVKMNGSDLTVPSVSDVAATKAPTGLDNDNGYEVSRYTVTITLNETVTGDLTIYNCTTYAGYVESITINPAN